MLYCTNKDGRRLSVSKARPDPGRSCITTTSTPTTKVYDTTLSAGNQHVLPFRQSDCITATRARLSGWRGPAGVPEGFSSAAQRGQRLVRSRIARSNRRPVTDAVLTEDAKAAVAPGQLCHFPSVRWGTGRE